MTRLLTAICVVLLGCGAAACDVGPSEPRPLAPHSERKGPVGPVPAGLERFYGQTVRWGPCADYATSREDRATYEQPGIECARLTVPLDYQAPQGQTVTIGLLRKPAGDPEQRIGSLFVNPGGPGVSGMSSAASLSTMVGTNELGERFDLVGFDPRGVGASQPEVRCLDDAESDADRLDSDADTSPAGVAVTEQENRQYAERCAQRMGVPALAHIGTREVVKDLDVLRSALGDRKLSYLGYSYGTLVGSEYAEEFPGNVRALVLDGAIDPGQSTVDSMVAQAAGFQQAFEGFARSCAGQQKCALGTRPEKAVAEFQRLTRPLVDRPVPAGKGRLLSYSDATTGTVQALYATELWGRLNTALLELSQGRGQTMMRLADAYYGRAADGHYSNVTDAFNAIRCVDDQRVLDRAQIQEADRRYREKAPIFDDGRQPSSAMDPCAFWPAPVTGEATPPKVTGLPPTLVISTTGDPATPYQAGVELANALHGRLLSFTGIQHTVFLQGNDCVDQAGVDYLVDLQLPEQGTRCGP